MLANVAVCAWPHRTCRSYGYTYIDVNVFVRERERRGQAHATTLASIRFSME
jgi:hypothetical protein